MKKYLEKRVYDLASFMLKEKTTIRDISRIFNISKSTVHLDLSKRLKKINYPMFLKVEKILNYNFENKHIRGGEATKNKYKK